MPPKSLADLAIKAGSRAVSKLEDVGIIPYNLVKTLLAAVEDPAQLLRIEKNSPHIAEKDADLWKAFIARDIHNGLDKMVAPEFPRFWHRVYYDLLEQEQKMRKESEEKLLNTLKGLDREKEKKKVTFVSGVTPQPKKKFSRSFGASTPSHHTPATTLAAKQGQSIMNKIRKEGAASANAQKNRIVIRTQAQQEMLLQQARSQIKSAPISMVRAHAGHKQHIPVLSQRKPEATMPLNSAPRRLPSDLPPLKEKIIPAAVPRVGDSLDVQPERKLFSVAPLRPAAQRRPNTSIFMPSKKRKL